MSFVLSILRGIMLNRTKLLHIAAYQTQLPFKLLQCDRVFVNGSLHGEVKPAGNKCIYTFTDMSPGQSYTISVQVGDVSRIAFASLQCNGDCEDVKRIAIG